LFRYKEIGWREIGEVFYRWTVIDTPWFSIYIHYLDAKLWHGKCHDHPWWFLALILSGGYWERAKGKIVWRGVGSFLYRPAEFSHNVMTPSENWSLIVVGSKTRQWGFHDCETV
jgi:hypothetical protein